ncbi:MAG: hypothetical protein GXY36_07575 [Chloroflexi bacterium]|nr:hypothetical protein [Chloroflexota bacterium]
MSEERDRRDLPPSPDEVPDESIVGGPPAGLQPPRGEQYQARAESSEIPAPVGQYPPPPEQIASQQRGSPIQRQAAANWSKQADSLLDQLNIDRNLALKVVIIALVSGAVAALLDEILGLPTAALQFRLGGFVAALSGGAYAYYTRKSDLPCAIMGFVAGALAFVAWFLVMEIISETWTLNVLKAIVTGGVSGLIGCGWFAILQRLPYRLLS